MKKYKVALMFLRFCSATEKKSDAGMSKTTEKMQYFPQACLFCTSVNDFSLQASVVSPLLRKQKHRTHFPVEGENHFF